MIFEEKARGFLGLCMRAGKVVTGTDAVIDALRAGKARVVVLDEEISEGSRKRLCDKAGSFGSKVYSLRDIGPAIGKSGIMALCVKGDMGEKLSSLLDDRD